MLSIGEFNPRLPHLSRHAERLRPRNWPGVLRFCNPLVWFHAFEKLGPDSDLSEIVKVPEGWAGVEGKGK